MPRKVLYRIIALFLFVVAISVGVIYFTFDIRALEYLTMFEPWSILLALGCLFIGLCFDALRLVTLTKITGETLPALDVIKVVLSNYFLALVTPGATGGAVAQIMFMKKAGIPVAKSTVVIFVRTIMSILFLIIVVPFFMNVDSAVKGWVPMYVIVTVSLIFSAMPIAAV